MKTFHWTDELVAQAIKLRDQDDLSSSQIAAAIGCPTRNAVIGKLARVDLANARKAGVPVPVRERKHRAAPRTNDVHLTRVSVQAINRRPLRRITDRIAPATVASPTRGRGRCRKRRSLVGVNGDTRWLIARSPAERA